MSNKKPVLTVEDLCLQIGDKKVLNHASTHFNPGETVLIAGNNGSGKSSLLRCIAGIYFPDSGRIRPVDGLSKQKIGFISDQMSLFEQFTLQEGIDFHCKVFDIESFDDSLLAPLNLHRKLKIKDLSNGERALFHLSLLISQKPELLMVDEIIHTIDPYLRELFLEALIELIDSCNTSIIMVNHTFSEMGRLPERVLIMQDGRFILDEMHDALEQKVRKIIVENTPGKDELHRDIPVIFTKKTSYYTEYYVYPFTTELEDAHRCDFRTVELTEIIKSFIGGYYARKRK
jgi:ABC-type multidrug transport system ATPase subunit